jgi:hypothetical protein
MNLEMWSQEAEQTLRSIEGQVAGLLQAISALTVTHPDPHLLKRKFDELELELILDRGNEQTLRGYTRVTSMVSLAMQSNPKW